MGSYELDPQTNRTFIVTDDEKITLHDKGKETELHVESMRLEKEDGVKKLHVIYAPKAKRKKHPGRNLKRDTKRPKTSDPF